MAEPAPAAEALAPLEWAPADLESGAAPAEMLSLLERAAAGGSAPPAFLLRLAAIKLHRYDHAGALDAYAAVLAREPDERSAALGAARCLLALERPREALDVLSGLEPDAAVLLLSGTARPALGDDASAEADLRTALAVQPSHSHALWRLNKLLRRQGRQAELLALCERLYEAGVDHTQLLYDWGAALARAGEDDRARAILFRPERVVRQRLAPPAEFGSAAAFNDALADELLSAPVRLREFPSAEQANRGSERVHSLLMGRRPELIQALVQRLEAAVSACLLPRLGAFDPWLDARPRRVRLQPWGLIQRGGAYEAWHLHRGGWMSGVYYVEVPDGVTTDGDGAGCIEFGLPRSLLRDRPDLADDWRHAPRPGDLLLSPSHFPHRTIPTGQDAHRISFAFDVVPA